MSDAKTKTKTGTVGVHLPKGTKQHVGNSNGYPLIGVRLRDEDADVMALVNTAVENKFAKTPADVLRRCARLFLMPMYGDNKRVQGAVEDVRKIKLAKGFAV